MQDANSDNGNLQCIWHGYGEINPKGENGEYAEMYIANNYLYFWGKKDISSYLTYLLFNSKDF